MVYNIYTRLRGHNITIFRMNTYFNGEQLTATEVRRKLREIHNKVEFIHYYPERALKDGKDAYWKLHTCLVLTFNQLDYTTQSIDDYHIDFRLSNPIIWEESLDNLFSKCTLFCSEKTTYPGYSDVEKQFSFGLLQGRNQQTKTNYSWTPNHG